MDATATFKTMKNDALRQWRSWAGTLADGGPPPPPLEVLEAGAVLGVREPMASLESDATAIRDERSIREQADRQAAAITAKSAADGGPAGVRAALAAARKEVVRLQRLAGVHPGWLAVGRARAEADKIRERHPRVFATDKRPQAKRKGGRA
jgi:hypothetical protein